MAKEPQLPLLNFESLLQSMPDLYLILDARFDIVAVSDAYAKATYIIPDEVTGLNIFDVFPDNPNDPAATGVNNLRQSLERVLKNKKADTMAVQKYDIASKDGGAFEEHYWSPLNSPILNQKGVVEFIIHRVEDVTEFVNYKKRSIADKSNMERMEIEIFRRAQEIQEANTRIHASEERLRLFIDSCKDYALFMLDTNGFIMNWNTGAEQIKGYKAHEIIGKHFSIFYPSERVEERYPEHELEMAIKNGRYEDEGWRIRKDGSHFWANVIITAIYDSEHRHIGFGKVTRDLTERKRSEEEITYLSNHDILTNLYNRTAFVSALKRELSNAGKSNTSIAVLMLDLDNFKAINDTFGHHIGDQLLILVARQLRDSVRAQDFVARLGGDEFVIIFPNIKDEINVIHLAQDLIKRFNKPFKFENHFFHATVSIGIAVSPSAGVDEVSLMKNADIALYSVKELGRNNYQIFSEKIRSVFKRNAIIEDSMPHAIEQDQLSLVYQPQYNITSKQIIGMEALLRWENPELGTIYPGEFIHIAEKNGYIIEIGEWVLRNACQQFMHWKTAGLVSDDIKLAVNISPKQLIKDSFVKTFLAILEETGMRGANIEFELTESAVMSSSIEVDSIFEQLQNIGVRISIDDFGVGYSSLSRLKSLPVSSLKIDKSFIDAMEKGSDDAKIVKSIIALGNNLGLNVIPEGVETEQQVQLLKEYHCQMVQGYFFGKPLKIDEMTNLLQSVK